MGVGGNFWDLLKPHGRREGADFLRDKKVAVDLSFWIVQQETAVSRCRNPRALKPHLRLTFFRTINLFAKMGAFPVFVVDGEPSPLKARARIERFCRATGLDVSACSVHGEGAGVKRNRVFTGLVDECVELLELFGMPVMKAKSEAEALCAQLNADGHVDACLTADSDTLLFGAKCVIKCIHTNSREPFECYNMSDIEAALGLKRKQLIAISLLVGNDHNLNGVRGIGLDTALRFVQLFPDDEILERICDIGKGIPLSQFSLRYPSGIQVSPPDVGSERKRLIHCSSCGHPGSRTAHVKSACETCFAYGGENCIAKSEGFKCQCMSCVENDGNKELKRQESWRLKVCQKIADEHGFPKMDIINIYTCSDHNTCQEKDSPLLWESPRVDELIDFLVYHLHWEPSYIRQRILPMMTTMFLREVALNHVDGVLLLGQYEFDSIYRIKIRWGQPYYMVKWKRVAPTVSPENSFEKDDEICEIVDLGSADLLDAEDVPKILDGCYMVTDENICLVEAAFPEEVSRFTKEKELKAQNSKSRTLGEDEKSPDTSISTCTQLNITQFYRRSKALAQAKQKQKSPDLSPQKNQIGEKKFSKSVRRRLLFD